MNYERDDFMDKERTIEYEYPKPKNRRKKRPNYKQYKKIALIAAPCVAVVLIVTIVLISLLGGGANNFALYIKGSQMYFTEISDTDPLKLTEKLFVDGIDRENPQSSVTVLSYYTHLTEDGEILFYPDMINYKSDGLPLYFRYVNDADSPAVKIDSEVVSYSVNEDGDIITYINGIKGELYQYDLSDKTKIDSGVSTFLASNDGEVICYLKKDGTLYWKTSGKSKEKLDDNVIRILHFNKDFDTVYYLKGDEIYKKSNGKKKVKIDSGVSAVLKTYDSGEIYYVKNENKEVLVSDYIDDDKKGADAILTEESLPARPIYGDYGNHADYLNALDDYENAQENWLEKQKRDELRRELEGKTVKVTDLTLYLSDNSGVKKISDAYYAYHASAENSPVLVISTYGRNYGAKVKLSEINNIKEAEEKIQSGIYCNEKQIIIGDKASNIDQDAAKNFRITSDGSAVYYLDNVSEHDLSGELYKIEISGNKAGKSTLYADKVYFSIELTGNDKLIYFCDVQDEYSGELYIDNQKIDSEVNVGKYKYYEKDGYIAYMKEWTVEYEYGTLMLYKDGKSVKVRDEVHDYTITPGGEILYLHNYVTIELGGDLYLYNDGEAEKIDNKVSFLIPIVESKYRGSHTFLGEKY